jgi:hypothetical protein
MAFAFKKATKTRAKLRMAIHGPSGSGKTYTALAIALNLVEHGQRVAVLDTEYGSASKYSNIFDFDVMEITDNYHPDQVGQAIRAAAEAGYGAIVIDSGTHFWNGTGGFLELVDREVANMRARNQKPDSFAAWKVVDPIYKRMVASILSAPIHVIITLRAKTEYEKTTGENGGKGGIRKVGMAPEMRDNFQYEMDIEGMLSIDHDLVIGKTRCAAIDGKLFHRPGKELAATLSGWLNDGAEPPPVVKLVTHWRDFTPDGATQDDLSWTDDQREGFTRALAAAGLKYDEVAEWTAALDKGRPSQWPRALRESLWRDLKNGGRREFEAWLSQRAAS